MQVNNFKKRLGLGLGLGAALVLTGCAVRPLPPYNPPPIVMPTDASAQPQAQIPTQTSPVPPSTLPNTSGAGQTPPPAPSASGTVSDERHLVALASDLNGAEVMPATDSAGTGELVAVYNRNTRQLRWKSNLKNLRGEITGASFHGPADIDQNAPAIIEWNSAAGRSVYEGRATLTAEQASDMLAGLWYVSVRTRAYPQGELRGQISIR